MLEETYFQSPDELKDRSIEAQIKRTDAEGNFLGGILWREEVDPETQKKKSYVYIGNPHEEHPTVVRLETRASAEDIEAIRKEIIPMEESCEILEKIAVAYKLRQPLLLEGTTAIGKTFLVDRFTELLYGRGVKPLDFYCSGQTDVSELMAKWVPKVETAEEKEKWRKFTESLLGQEQLSEITQEVARDKGLSLKQKDSLLYQHLRELTKTVGLSEKTQWQFQYGAVPRAMGLIVNPDGSFSFDEGKGDGFILHVEEVGLAEPQVINALLKLRGREGKLAKEIQLWEDGGRKVKAGPNFWLVFSTNPPEEYLARNEVDPALARSVVFTRVDELSEESLELAAEYYFTYKLGKKPEKKQSECILDIYNHPQIGKEVAKVIAAFHGSLGKELKKGEKGRQQRIPLTLDDMARVAEYLVHLQVRSLETGRLDLSETLKRAVQLYYLDRLADPNLKKIMADIFEDMIFNTTGATGVVKFEGRSVSRKEVFDILVERASSPETEREERERQELGRARNDLVDQIEAIVVNPNVSSETIDAIIKEILINPDVSQEIREEAITNILANDDVSSEIKDQIKKVLADR